MTAYFDTSALLKLYLDEVGSDALRDVAEQATVSTCRITWAEAFAALARRERESPHTGLVWSRARERLTGDWPLFQVIDVTQHLVEQAGELASAFGLRGYDAVQLAAAHAMTGALGAPPVFITFDRRLNRAARLLGLVLPDGAPL